MLMVLTHLCSHISTDEVKPVVDQLELLAKYKIDIPEPSGFDIDSSGKYLYTVSDKITR